MKGLQSVYNQITNILNENDVLLAKNNLLQEENEKLKADLRGKDNEINDLKERIAYLKRFKPKEKTIPIKQK